MLQEKDTKYMGECLQLAKEAEGRTQPNPLAGSIIVSDAGEIIGEGFHQKAGEAHAEIIALEKAGAKAKGQTLYVNLEPCCHQGRTGPCTDKIIAAGIKRVVIGSLDPNPKVSGGGVKKLQEARIEVVSGIMEDECRYLNRSFIKWITTGKPWVILKIASTLDGRIADRRGTSRWISNPESRQFVQELRNIVDVVLVGPSTVVIDNPQLTVTGVDNPLHPIRATVDPSFDIDPSMKIFNKLETNCRSIDGKQVILFTNEEILQKKSKRPNYEKHIEVVGIKNLGNHTEDHHAKLNMELGLKWLGQKNVLSVLCEGGGKFAASLINQKLIDEIHWIIAPKLLLDSRAMLGTHLNQAIPLDQAINLKKVNSQALGEDVLLTYLTSYQ